MDPKQVNSKWFPFIFIIIASIVNLLWSVMSLVLSGIISAVVIFQIFNPNQPQFNWIMPTVLIGFSVIPVFLLGFWVYIASDGNRSKAIRYGLLELVILLVEFVSLLFLVHLNK